MEAQNEKENRTHPNAAFFAFWLVWKIPWYWCDGSAETEEASAGIDELGNGFDKLVGVNDRRINATERRPKS